MTANGASWRFVCSKLVCVERVLSGLGLKNLLQNIIAVCYLFFYKKDERTYWRGLYVLDHVILILKVSQNENCNIYASVKHKEFSVLAMWENR